jgi:hypothetical protein
MATEGTRVYEATMKRWFVAILLVSMALGNGWCQSEPPKTAADLAKYLGTDRERILYDGAKKEGKLVIYASASAQQLQMYIAPFQKRYPFIKTALRPSGNFR